MDEYEIEILTEECPDIITEKIKQKYKDISKLEFDTVWNPRDDVVVYSVLVVGKLK